MTAHAVAHDGAFSSDRKVPFYQILQLQVKKESEISFQQGSSVSAHLFSNIGVHFIMATPWGLRSIQIETSGTTKIITIIFPRHNVACNSTATQHTMIAVNGNKEGRETHEGLCLDTQQLSLTRRPLFGILIRLSHIGNYR